MDSNTERETEIKLDKIYDESAEEDLEILSDIEDSPINETKPPRKARKKKGRFPVLPVCMAACAFLLIAGYFAYPKLLSKNKDTDDKPIAEETEPETSHVDPEDPLSNENIQRSVDENVIGPFKFLLYGDNEATDPDDESRTLTFNFEADGSYIGQFKNESEDFGTYELYSENGDIYVVITCHGTSEVYEITLNEDNNVVLTKLNKQYVLQRKQL